MTDTKQQLINRVHGVLTDITAAETARGFLENADQHGPYCLHFDDADEYREAFEALSAFGLVDKADCAAGESLSLRYTPEDCLEEIQQQLEPLDLIVCKSEDGRHTSISMCFAFGGPNIFAERGPRDAHFTISGGWGDDTCSETDYRDLIPGFYGALWEE